MDEQSILNIRYETALTLQRAAEKNMETANLHREEAAIMLKRAEILLYRSQTEV
jgi:hypothetical protein